MSSSALCFPFEKLRGRENFDVWKQQAKSYMVIKGLWKTIEVGLSAGATQADKDVDSRASAEIYLMVDPSNYGILAEKTTAKEAWDSLMEAYEDKGLTRKVGLLKQLVQLKLADFPSMQQYINAMILTSVKVKTAGLKLDEELIASLLLAGLPNEYMPLVLAVENSKKVLTIDSVKSLLLQDVKFDVGSNNESALYTANGKTNNKNAKSKKNFRCHKCKEHGHFARDCIKKEKKEYRNQVLLASLCINAKTSPTDYYIDSGSTNHMIFKRDTLKNVKPVQNMYVTTADNNKLNVACVGDVELCVSNNNKEERITVKDVQAVPNLAANLLSVSQMTKNGKRIVFEDDLCKIIDKNNNKVVASANLVNGLYKLNCAQNQIKEKNTIVGNVFTMVNYDLLHRRLGHISCDLVTATATANELKINAKGKTKCEVCVKGKHTRLPFGESENSANDVLGILHTDVMGPFSTASYSGARYLLTFVDDYTRKVFVKPIKAKSEVFEEFVKLKNFVENQCSKRIKILRSDNGKEYINTNFKKYLEKFGILHQTTTPYTPQQNGVAERMNRTLMERVRCMLIDAGLGEKFWAEAANTAAYVSNRTVRKSDSFSPEELWIRKKVNLKHLRVFGCRALAQIPKQKRTSKLAERSKECILVGYSETAKAYRLFDPTTKSIVISRDVVFLEDEKPISIVLPQNNCFNDFWQQPRDVNSEGQGGNIELSSQKEALTDAHNSSSASDDTVIEDRSSENTRNELNEDSYIQTDDDNVETYIPDESVTTGNTQVRRSERLNHLRTSHNFCAMSFILEEPQTVDDALSCENANDWKSAMKEEMEAHSANCTWELAELPTGKKAIQCKWIFKNKIGADGETVRHKARLVIKGCSQKKGVDYQETFAPVVRYTSLRFLLALSVQHNFVIHQMDAVTAFLNGELEEDIYMVQPAGFDDNSGRVCKLKKSLYGLKQASRVWNEKLNTVLLKFGLQRSEVDQCIYYAIEEDDMLFFAIYVDDVLMFGKDLKKINKLKESLMKCFKMKDMGEASSVLGMRVTREDCGIKIDQSMYITKVLKRFGRETCHPISTPIDVNQKLTTEMCPKTDIERAEMAKVPYMEAIGCLLYVAQISRPDICYAVNKLSRFSTNPGKAHWIALKRILRYLQGTINKCIFFRKSPEDIIGYCDADWASDIDSRRSTTGYIFMFQHGPISWATKRQPTVALSSTEAELMSIVCAIKESVWLKRLQHELIANTPKMLMLFCDNKSAMFIASNNSFSARTKHVDIKAKFVQEKIANGEVVLEYIKSENMLADNLTKAVDANKMQFFTNEVGLN